MWRWQRWLPVDTNCIPGFGLVDGRGLPVSSRSAAVTCGLCSYGSFSIPLVDDFGGTFTCVSCSMGSYQALPGETMCLQCAPGKFAADNGLSACEACGLGSYANSSGMTHCQKCGTGSAQWTTSRATTVHGKQRWIEVEAAGNESLCRCARGWFLHEGDCQPCSEGAVCPGSNELELIPGFFSSSEDPGSVFRCYGDASRCPGGRPGTCAFGRDPGSVACSACLPGLRPSGAACEPCGGGDYAIVVLVMFFILGGTGALHLLLLRQDQNMINKQGGLFFTNLYITQLVVCLQLVIVIGKVDITWDEPFVMILEFFSFLSLKELLASLHAISCVTRLPLTAQFLLQALAVPAAFMAAPIVLHVARALWRKGGLQLHLLFETLGSLSVLFFIVLCTAVVEPFQCQLHPNGLSTVQSSKGGG